MHRMAATKIAAPAAPKIFGKFHHIIYQCGWETLIYSDCSSNSNFGIWIPQVRSESFAPSIHHWLRAPFVGDPQVASGKLT